MDDTTKLSAHAICTLAQAMRECAACQYNPGRVLKPQDTIKPTFKPQKEIKQDEKTLLFS